MQCAAHTVTVSAPGSGFGRELGPAGAADCHETKHLWRNTRPTRQGWFD
ncbi:hypothetical protein GCM10017668_09820 [Streptomyces tuirus]|uniref:Uncharacterized protein n=1 Tax=Streptomyces tuirus TaxID=68278 RepID=A0A7G1N8K1_9ACTN|nr:hypothetical protein GCM10017668_09820 [Streptomyces tuirus]